MIDSVRQVGSLIFLGLAVVFLLMAIFRDGWRRLTPTEKQETTAFIALGCLGIAYLMDPQAFR